MNKPPPLLLIVDIQDRLARTMDQTVLSRVCAQINLLATLADELKIPIFLTEQYPQALWPTLQPLKKIL